MSFLDYLHFTAVSVAIYTCLKIYYDYNFSFQYIMETKKFLFELIKFTTTTPLNLKKKIRKDCLKQNLYFFSGILTNTMKSVGRTFASLKKKLFNNVCVSRWKKTF